MGKIRLREYLVSEHLWNELIEYFSNYEGYGSLLKVAKKEDFMYGSPDKANILIDLNENSMCVDSFGIKSFDPTANVKTTYKKKNDWLCYQQLITLDKENGSDTFGNPIIEFSPQLAVREHNRVLHKYYSNEEIEECLKAHSRDKFNMQQHDVIADKGVIKCFKNCNYYDINGAHTYLLSQIFPKAKEDYEYWNAHKHDLGCERYKQIPNYAVGCLANSHRGTYNWIINEVNNLMYNAYDIVDEHHTADYVYINTDGFIIHNATKELETSKELGKFKEEYRGDVYTYRGANYWIIQYGDTIKGNLPKELRKYVDLRIGKVVKYDRVRKEFTTTEGKTRHIYYNINIKEEIINEQEIC